MRSGTISTPTKPLVVALCAALLILGCDDQSAHQPSPISRKAMVADNGATIVFPADSPGLGQLSTTTAKKGTAMISVIAPARVVASVVPLPGDTGKTVVFDSPDVTSLYSQYRQSASNVERSSRNLARMREVFANQGATARDLNEAENDAATSRASFAEMEGKLIGLGFNPRELGSARIGTLWLISDVPENELHEVQKGEDVDVRFTAFPDRKYIGTAEEIGAVIDPVTRTVKVRVSLKNPKGDLRPGMFAGVDFGDPQPGVILIPLQAIVTVEGNDYVFVETAPGTFQRRQLVISNADDKQAIISQGLDGGEQVVTSGAMLLKGLSFGY